MNPRFIIIRGIHNFAGGSISVCTPSQWLHTKVSKSVPSIGEMVSETSIRFSRVRAMGIRDRPISPRSPWQNPYVERLIGTMRRECVDRVLVFGEAHLRQILSSYAAYYNEVRTHLALGKD